MTVGKKNAGKKLEIRRSEDIRAVGDSGEFEGYITVWDTVDSYESTFKRGAFSKTINERASKVKVFYNHRTLIGSALDIREDDYGCFVRGRINLGTETGRETYALLQAGDLDGLSFGFVTVKDGFIDGVRQINEVKLYEFGPVDFPANEMADITDVRAAEIIAACEGACEAPEEGRATDFNDTLNDADLRSGGYRLLDALYETLMDVWWGDEFRTNAEHLAALDNALAEFHAQYLEWASAYMARFWTESESRSMPGGNDLSAAFIEYQNGATVADLATRTSFTTEELQALRRGKPIEARGKLMELPESLRTAHAKERGTAVETLCREIRSGLTEAEKRRILALLKPAAQEARQSEPVAEQTVSFLSDFRTLLKKRG